MSLEDINYLASDYVRPAHSNVAIIITTIIIVVININIIIVIIIIIIIANHWLHHPIAPCTAPVSTTQHRDHPIYVSTLQVHSWIVDGTDAASGQEAAAEVNPKVPEQPKLDDFKGVFDLPKAEALYESWKALESTYASQSLRALRNIDSVLPRYLSARPAGPAGRASCTSPESILALLNLHSHIVVEWHRRAFQ
jgi:hypothetical protein